MGAAALPFLLITAAISTGVSIYSSVKANQAQQRALKFQRQQAEMQAAQQRRDTIRASRIAAANVAQEAANQGVQQTSAAQGGQASIQSQANANLSFLDKYNFLSDQASIEWGKQAKYASTSDVASSIGNLALNVWSETPGSHSIPNPFKHGR